MHATDYNFVLQDYIGCAEIWIEYVAQHFGVSELYLSPPLPTTYFFMSSSVLSTNTVHIFGALVVDADVFVVCL